MKSITPQKTRIQPAPPTIANGAPKRSARPNNIEPAIKNPPMTNFKKPILMPSLISMCYNIVTYKLPPLAARRFERLRQLASGCQDRHVCQFHHAAVKSGGSAPAKRLLPLTLSYKTIAQSNLFVNVICSRINVNNLLFVGGCDG